ncbi:MPN domain-containing protein [Tachyglossus aculeatus]|uniref:MPN domain-containing protein n=1 Tax=Tachyglossus aculeatus TaxID=9261 RepID=UPI0018F528A9|nr:MPN domain-containing protein [Tachyglossus aculeatus]
MAALDSQSPGTGGDEALEEDEEEPEPGLEDPEKLIPGIGRGGLLTRRGVTLRVLLKDGLIEPGTGVLSIYYLGKKFLADLLPDGKIMWQETGQVFNSPSAWATHCKKLVNPAKKSGCGWASVRYQGQKLDQYKAAWLKKHQPNAPATDESLLSEGEEEEPPPPQPPPPPPPPEEEEEEVVPPQEEPESLNKNRAPVRYCTLGSRDSGRSPHTLVEVMSFSAINKFQPFNVAVSSNVLLLLDFHSHLTRSEVVGYLGGRWDTNSQLLTVLRAFPCRSRLGDADTAAATEEEICQNLYLRGLVLVGWYHSHPFSPALPSLQDIDAQMDYQLRLQGSVNSFQPCLALVCAPYYPGNQGPESTISPFWVMSPPEQRPNDYGIPMEVEMAYVQDGFLTNDILHEMVQLVEFYKGASDLVKFQDNWSQDQTFLDKLKVSLACRTPKDQGFNHGLEQIYNLLKQNS